MTNNAEREGFEKWAMGTYSIKRHYGLPDQYAAIAVQVAWGAWQARAQASGVPDGWKLVPIAMDMQMHQSVRYKVNLTYAQEKLFWSLALAAAPTPPKSDSVPCPYVVHTREDVNYCRLNGPGGVPVESLEALYYECMGSGEGCYASNLAALIAEYKA
jgi:hypothetical protein